jgi:hypothetical protein
MFVQTIQSFILGAARNVRPKLRPNGIKLGGMRANERVGCLRIKLPEMLTVLDVV